MSDTSSPSTSLSRRRMLGLLAGSAAALSLSRAALADPPPPPQVLEIFLAGGLSHRETLWVYKETPDDQVFPHLGTTSTALPAFFQAGSSPGVDGGGTQVYLGPGARVIAGATAGTALHRARLVLTGHDLAPHGPASGLMVCGLPDGRDRQASLAAAVNANAGGHASIVLMGDRTSVQGQVFTRTGRYGAKYRPLVVSMASLRAKTLLTSSATSPRAQLDVVHAHADRFERALTWSGTRVRSHAADAYKASLADAREGRAAVSTLLGGVSTGQGANLTQDAILSAATLLKAGKVRHAAVVDGGSLSAGYDAHNDSADQSGAASAHATTANLHLDNVLQAVHASKVLDEGVLVLVYSEFGRWRPPGYGLSGSGHWPYSFPVLLLGADVTRGVTGSLDRTREPAGTPSGHVSPAGIRAVLAHYLGLGAPDPTTFGIWPDEAHPNSTFASLQTAVLGSPS